MKYAPLLILLTIGPTPPDPPEWETVTVVFETRVQFHPTSGGWYIPTSTVVGWTRPELGPDVVRWGLPMERWITGAPVTPENVQRIGDVQARIHAVTAAWLHGEAPKWWPDPRVNR